MSLAEPNEGWEIVMQDGVFIKQMVLHHPGYEVAQHTHKYDHCSLLTLGQVRLWRDGVLWGDFIAPHIIEIKAGVAHRFLALTPAVVYCIHNISRTGEVEVLVEALAE